MLEPGATAFTRTPASAHSTDSDLVRLSTPARAAPGPHHGKCNHSKTGPLLPLVRQVVSTQCTCVRHHGEPPEHVRDDVDDDAAVVAHVLAVRLPAIVALYYLKHAAAADLHISQVPVRLVSTTALHPFRLMSAAPQGNWPPPLLTRKSSLPNLSSVN